MAQALMAGPLAAIVRETEIVLKTTRDNNLAVF